LKILFRDGNRSGRKLQSLIFAIQKQKIMIKKLTLAVMLGAFTLCSFAQQLNTPQPSPTQEVKQNFGLSKIELSYSRPAMKGRKIFGDLVPYGKVWRTGANQATTLTFGDEVTIGGTKIPAGKYGLLTIPDAGEWTVIITKQTDVTSPAAYKQDQDVVRVKAKPVELGFQVESFTILIGDVTGNSCNLQLVWDNLAVALPITTDVDSKVSAQIKDLMEKDNRPYFSAAMYYVETGKDLNQALAWLEKATAANPDAFWMHYQKARVLAKLGKKQDALAASNKSVELAKAAKSDDYVALNMKLQNELK
jgi:tetratricopeptide (TPR) repeat protein